MIYKILTAVALSVLVFYLGSVWGERRAETAAEERLRQQREDYGKLTEEFDRYRRSMGQAIDLWKGLAVAPVERIDEKGSPESMNIYQAACEAKKVYGAIARKSWNGHMKIIPTDDSECCVVYTDEGRTPRWQPHARDLLADDWVVVKAGCCPICEFTCKRAR